MWEIIQAAQYLDIKALLEWGHRISRDIIVRRWDREDRALRRLATLERLAARNGQSIPGEVQMWGVHSTAQMWGGDETAQGGFEGVEGGPEGTGGK